MTRESEKEAVPFSKVAKPQNPANLKYKGTRDFFLQKASDIKSGILSDKVRHLKESEKGGGYMCRIMQDFAKEERAEVAKKLLKQNKMTLEEIAEITEIPLETVKQLSENL